MQNAIMISVIAMYLGVNLRIVFNEPLHHIHVMSTNCQMNRCSTSLLGCSLTVGMVTESAVRVVRVFLEQPFRPLNPLFSPSKNRYVEFGTPANLIIPSELNIELGGDGYAICA